MWDKHTSLFCVVISDKEGELNNVFQPPVKELVSLFITYNETKEVSLVVLAKSNNILEYMAVIIETSNIMLPFNYTDYNWLNKMFVGQTL